MTAFAIPWSVPRQTHSMVSRRHCGPVTASGRKKAAPWKVLQEAACESTCEFKYAELPARSLGFQVAESPLIAEAFQGDELSIGLVR